MAMRWTANPFTLVRFRVSSPNLRKQMLISKHFCPQPFVYIYPNHDGSWKPCCKAGTYPKKNMSFDEWWYEDQDLNDLRKALLSDEWSRPLEDVCGPCFGPESRGVKSYRQFQVETWSEPLAKGKIERLISFFKHTGEVQAGERMFIVQVKGIGNQCNLKCYMCAPHNSTSRTTELLKGTEETAELFYKGKGMSRLIFNKTAYLNTDSEKKQLFDVIEELGPYIKKLNFSGGEPAMIGNYYDLMDKIIETGNSKHIQIFMNSNLTRLNLKNRSMADYFPRFDRFDIQASVDDIFERDEYIRYPSKFKKVLENYQYLNSINNVNMSINVTWSLLNAANAENICDFFTENKYRISRMTNFVSNPIELHVKNHPLKDELMERFKESKYRTVREVALEMNDEYNELEFFKAVAYIKDLDRIRNTQSWKVFPELSNWLK